MKPYTQGELMGMTNCELRTLIGVADAKKMHYEAREVTTISEKMEIDTFEVVYTRIKNEQQRRGM